MTQAPATAAPRRLRLPRLRTLLRALAMALVLFLALPYLIAPLYRVIDPVSTLMLWRTLGGQRVERAVVPLAKMGPHLPAAVLAAEDARFCAHRGVDLRELRDALDRAEQRGSLRGASTITQQTVKNLFLWPNRSYVRKALEVPLALWVDLVLPKRRILEIYLNIAEWGPNGDFGADAAARRAFGKSVEALSPREAALLAATLPNPRLRDPRRAGPGLSRLAGMYQTRAARVTRSGGTACLRTPSR